MKSMSKMTYYNKNSFVSSFIIFLVISVSGCSQSLIKMKPEEREKLSTISEVTAGHDGSASLSVMTPGKSVGMLFGAIGGAISGAMAVSEGKQIMSTFSIPDPSEKIKRQFVADLERAGPLKNIQVIEESLLTDNAKDLKLRYQGHLFIFKTGRWELNSTMVRGAHLHYAVVGRLLRLTDEEILWQGSCDYTDDDPEPRSIEELSSNQGTLLKEKIDRATNTCARELLAQFLDGKA